MCSVKLNFAGTKSNASNTIPHTILQPVKHTSTQKNSEHLQKMQKNNIEKSNLYSTSQFIAGLFINRNIASINN